ncbi:unnamed protein product, partial [Timema podura]|nr:unnamed protein product [Timema podura]
SEIDLPIKSEKGLEEEWNYYQQAECLPVPFLPIKGELPKHQENLILSIPLEQYVISQKKSNGVICDSVQTKNKRVNFPKYTKDVEGCSKPALKEDKCINLEGIAFIRLYKHAQKECNCIKHGGTQFIRTCKEEGCAKYPQKGGKCIKHGGTQIKKSCKEEGCTKLVQKGGRCWKHGETKSIKLCNEEECVKRAQKGDKCIKHGGTQAMKPCKEEGCTKTSFKGW